MPGAENNATIATSPELSVNVRSSVTFGSCPLTVKPVPVPVPVTEAGSWTSSSVNEAIWSSVVNRSSSAAALLDPSVA
jgi:hypothetical protein